MFLNYSKCVGGTSKHAPRPGGFRPNWVCFADNVNRYNLFWWPKL